LRYLRATGRQVSERAALSFAESIFDAKLPDGLGSDYSEPISVYRAFAEYLIEILARAAEIYSGKFSASDWLERYPSRGYYPFSREQRLCGFDAAVHSVGMPVQRILDLSEGCFGLEWNGASKRFPIQTCTSGLLGSLAVQLMMAVTLSDALYTCSGCGHPYIRSAIVHEREAGRMITRTKRRPKTGQNNYCEGCGAKRARIDAKSRYRKRIKEARELFAAGTPIAHIAEQLDTEIENVERWTKENGKKTRARRRQHL
jgi:hypothetical protein